MAIAKTRTDLIGTAGSKTTITAGNSNLSSSKDCSDYVGILIGGNIDFGASPDDDVLIEVFSSPDDINFDTISMPPFIIGKSTPISVSSLTRSGTTATVNTGSAHLLNTGMFVTIAGANESEYNGTYQITVTGTTTFTYTVAGSPSTPATGTITSTPVVQKTIRIGPEVKYLKVKGTNNDTTDSIDAWIFMVGMTT